MLNRWINQHWTLFTISVLILAAGWIWASSRPASLPAKEVTSAPQRGFLAPVFNLNTIEGMPVDLAGLKGKVVLINFWASWCSPCRAEMNAIQNVYQCDQAQGLIVLAINTGDQDTKAIAQFAQAGGLTFPILFDADGAIAHLYQVGALPTSFFIDRQGKIQQVVVGGAMPEALISSQIDALLKETQ
jgi:cytochrome c biogenesis protein CcmG/thiol:disulfide interchange protein DsbE